MPIPTIGPGELLVSISACGICGTDVKTYLHGHAKIPPGAVLGHEIVGIVAASNSPRFSVGQRVAVAPYAPCLTCETCQRGYYSLCERLFDLFPEPGGFADLLRVPERIVAQGVLPIPDQLDDLSATLTEPLACCLHGLKALDLHPGQSLLVIGDGPMGLLQVMAAKQMGIAPIILSGMTPHRLAFARQIADVVVDRSLENLADVIASTIPGGVDKILVSVANEAVAVAAISLLRTGGGINLFAGMPHSTTITLPTNRIHYDEIRILGTFGFWPSHFQQALAMLSTPDFVLPGFITHTVHMDGIKDALLAASRYEGIKAVMVRDAV